MELLSKLGINWKLLLAQIVNFLILLFILHRFAYKPVLKMLNDRSSKIEKGLRDAEDSQKKLQEIAQKESEIMRNAREEAQIIIMKAEDIARKNKEEIIAEAKSNSEKVLKDAEKKIEEEKNKMMAEVTGKTAIEIVNTLIREEMISTLQHAADMGIELEKAELALRHGYEYIQDSDLMKL